MPGRADQMSGNRGIPIHALYDQPDQRVTDTLSNMLGSFDLDAYGAQDEVELRNLLAVVDREPATSGTGMDVPSVEIVACDRFSIHSNAERLWLARSKDNLRNVYSWAYYGALWCCRCRNVRSKTSRWISVAST
jgi:hypothetical protein